MKNRLGGGLRRTADRESNACAEEDRHENRGGRLGEDLRWEGDGGDIGSHGCDSGNLWGLWGLWGLSGLWCQYGVSGRVLCLLEGCKLSKDRPKDGGVLHLHDRRTLCN